MGDNVNLKGIYGLNLSLSRKDTIYILYDVVVGERK
jgi:hypothetical protein